ncbi:MAG: hypothetical protein WCQ99_14750, partial [Pseudomonadota bacterium]
MKQYDFLFLSVLFSVPGVIIYALRQDLRTVIIKIIPFSWPFAFTEFLFYPSYWEPHFLFDLGRKIGFGIEDFIFVSGLAAFTTTAYSFVSGRRYVALGQNRIAGAMLRCAGPFLATFILLVLALFFAVPVIYASCAAMLAVTGGMLVVRRDLVVPGLSGGMISLTIYYILCGVCELVMPGLFKT